MKCLLICNGLFHDTFHHVFMLFWENFIVTFCGKTNFFSQIETFMMVLKQKRQPQENNTYNFST